MLVKILETGSNGNAVLLKDGKICVDMGIPFREIQPHMKDLQVVFITHEHGDHFRESTIKRLSFERPSLRFACGEWLVPKLVGCGVNPKNIDILKMSRWYNYGDVFKVCAIPLTHDVPNCGFKFLFNCTPDPDYKIFYATDTENLNGIEAKEYDLYLLEANYTEEGIHDRIKAKQFEGGYIYEYRVCKTHLSKEKCDQWLVKNAGSNSRFSYLHGHMESKG